MKAGKIGNQSRNQAVSAFANSKQSLDQTSVGSTDFDDYKSINVSETIIDMNDSLGRDENEPVKLE